MVEVQVVIGTVHTVLVQADSVAAAEEVVMQWDPNGNAPAEFVAIGSTDLGRVTTTAVDVAAEDVREYAEEWADDNYGEIVNLERGN